VLSFTLKIGSFFKSILEDWEIILESYDFEELDRGVLVHIPKLKVIEVQLRIAYFHENQRDVYCTIRIRILNMSLKIIY
jgi:hypothetical protein